MRPRWLPGLFAGLLLSLPTAVPAAAPETVSGDGWRLQVPAEWTLQRGLLGADLIARPPRADTQGWAQDQLVLTREAYDPRRSCLDGFTMRKLRDMSHLATQFQVVEEQPLELGGAVATLLELRYQEGPRELQAYLMIMATETHMVVLSLASSPARFEFQRSLFRGIAESLRPGAAPQP